MIWGGPAIGRIAEGGTDTESKYCDHCTKMFVYVINWDMDEQERNKKHAEREKERRRRNGAVSREEYLKQSNDLNRDIISLFFDHASKPADIAKRLAVSRMTVHRALARWNDYVDEDNDSTEHGLDTK